MDEYYAAPARPPPSFVLAPVNKEARKVTAHARNVAYQERLENNTFGLRIDFSDPDKQEFTLGRSNDADIYLPESRSSKAGSDISPDQAGFVLVPETGAVLLCDHSQHRNTAAFSPDRLGYTVPFNEDRGFRAVLVARAINCRVAFGRDKWYDFEIQWDSDGLYALENDDEPYSLGPRRGKIKKYMLGAKIGAGTYGAVWSALDLYTGRWVALKRFHHISGKNLDFATREVKNLHKINQNMSINHEHVLEILDFAGGGKNDDWCEILMPLKMGNLKGLVEDNPLLDVADLADRVLRQMLLALKCTAEHNIIHRDIKPENILWEYDAEGGHYFCLGDFGLSNDRSTARTTAGTEPFMAPEIFNKKRQTEKVDMWSLFATIVWVRNTDHFRQRCPHLSVAEIHSFLLRIAQRPEYAQIRSMASYDPKRRPSADLMLRVLDGEELPPAPEAAEPVVRGLSNSMAHLSMGGGGGGEGGEGGGGDGEDGIGDGFDPDSMGFPEGLEMAYYEPYSPWRTDDQDADADAYQPPPLGGPPRDPNWVMPLEPAYADLDSMTAVPDQWTTRALKLSDDDKTADPKTPPLPPPSQQHHLLDLDLDVDGNPYLADGGPDGTGPGGGGSPGGWIPGAATPITIESDEATAAAAAAVAAAVRGAARKSGKGKGKSRK